ncbi:MAG: hypothetical protein WHS46_06780 [Desulfosoma sp.]
MRGCKDFEETLMLDVFGELNPDEFSRWSLHAAECDLCAAERRRLIEMVKSVKAAGIPEPISESEADRLRAHVRRALNNEASGGFPEKRPSLWRSFGWKPAWAFGLVFTAALLTGGLYWKMIPYAPDSTNTPVTTSAISTEDREVVENLDFLKELDTIRKLVSVVDKEAQESSSEDETEASSPPVSSHLKKESYV